MLRCYIVKGQLRLDDTALTLFRFYFYFTGFKAQQVPCVTIRIKPTFRIRVIFKPKCTAIVRQESAHHAVFVGLSLLSGIRQPFAVRSIKNLGHTLTWYNMNGRTIIFRLSKIYKAIK